jgi:hypothetical protein
VFFDKSFTPRHKLVIMDGNGRLKDESIDLCLCLSNLVIVHFSKQDLEEREIDDEFGRKTQKTILKEQLERIKMKAHKPLVALLIRDCSDEKVIKRPGDKKGSYNIGNDAPKDLAKFLSDNDDLVDICVLVTQMKDLQKRERVTRGMRNLIQMLHNIFM